MPRYQLLDCNYHRKMLWPAEIHRLEQERAPYIPPPDSPAGVNGDEAASDPDLREAEVYATGPDLDKPCTCPPGVCHKPAGGLNPGFYCEEERAQDVGAERAADENIDDVREERLDPGDDFTVAGELRIYIGADDDGTIGTRFRALDMTHPEIIGALRMVEAMVMRQALGQARDV
jgi:hypothetical protein